MFEPGAGNFTRALAHATTDNAEDIDARIERHAKGWTLDRIAPLERAILRLALLEMLHPDIVEGETPIPPEGAIDEAVELAKAFCGARRAGLRQRHPRRRLARGAREWRAPWLSPTAWTRWSSASSGPPPSCAPASSRPTRAAALVDDCARLAAEAGAELDRRVRAADAGPGVAGQLALES